VKCISSTNRAVRHPVPEHHERATLRARRSGPVPAPVANVRRFRKAVAVIGTSLVAVLVLVYLLPPIDTSPLVAARENQSPGSRTRRVPAAVRDEALSRAQVWREPGVPISQAFLGNPPGTPSQLDCTFRLDEPSGTTPKFDCVDAQGEKLRVKYGFGGELPAEAAATRLLTALGFGADSITLVEKLRCFGCPKDPFTVMKLVDVTKTAGLYERVADTSSFEVFNWVALERKFDAVAIETDAGQEGWAFFELEKVKAEKGGAPRAHVDALRLLAVFMAHWDNKSANQRLVCLSDQWSDGTRCESPFLLLQDVGATFGPRKVDLGDWEQSAIWADRQTCTVSMRHLPVRGATFENVQISEKGRHLLSGLLEQLTDQQLTDLFAGARVDQRRGPLDRNDPVSEWVRVFKARRSAIADGPACPPA
jgi:hypothetical protein